MPNIEKKGLAAAPSPWPLARSPLLPARVGRYEIIELLGVGGMAEVFKATSSGAGGFQRTVVIKRIHPVSNEDPQFVAMFVAEAKILGMLHHPNVVQAYDFGEADGSLFLVLEYVDGPSLLRAVQTLRSMGRPFPVAVAAHFAHEVCRALDYVHNLADSDGQPLHVVHRDVTPSNIVLTASGGLKLLDFGVARYSDSAKRSEHETIKGKAAYLAPEALRGEEIDGRVDLFALGVVLYEMLTLTELFSAADALTTLHKVLEMEIPPPSRTRPEVPEALDAIVMKALERDPARRYATAADMARDLGAFVVGTGMPAEQVSELVADLMAERARIGPPLSSTDMLQATPVDPAAGNTVRDLGLRFRMSRIWRFLFRRRDHEPH
jgi:serine/threonine-protein kinase